MAPTRLQKRWAPRLRTAGALLLLTGAVALIDRVLPRTTDVVAELSTAVQLTAAAGTLALGAALFLLGGRWR